MSDNDIDLTLDTYSENKTFSVLRFKHGRLPPLFNSPFDLAALSKLNVVVKTLCISRLLVSLLFKLNLFFSNESVRLVGEA